MSKATSTPPPVRLADRLDRIRRAGVDRVGRAESAGEGELLVGEVDRDDLARARDFRAEDRAQAHAAEADDRHRSARLDPRRVDHRADPSQHRAAEQGRKLERQVGIDLHAGFARDDRMGREGRDAEMVIDRLGAEGEPPLAGKQRPGAIGFRARLAEGGAAGGAKAAAAAARHEDQHDVIAEREVGHAFAERLDDARGLVAERHRDGPRAGAVDDGKIGMTEPRRLDPHQDLAAPGRGEVEFDDFERPRRRDRAGEARFC